MMYRIDGKADRFTWRGRELTQSFLATPAAVGAARRSVERTLLDWRLDGVVDDVTLIVSELVTNAVRAKAGGRVDLAVFRLPSYVGIEVHDEVPEPPVRRCPAAVDIGGRGLHIVDALAERWDVHQGGNGKAVCALVRIASLDKGTGRDRARPEPLVPRPRMPW